MKKEEVVRGWGYALVVLPPLLVMASAWTEWSWLAIAVLFVAAPLARTFLGDAPETQPEWSEAATGFLEAVPVVAAVTIIAATLALPLALQGHRSPLSWAGLFLGVWASWLFGTCVAHALAHQRDPGRRTLANIASATIGYPLLATEHRQHHRYGDSYARSECPRPAENVWQFSLRRLPEAFRHAIELHQESFARTGSRLADGLLLSASVWVALLAYYVFFAGVAGMLVFVGASIGVAWGMQAITYIQHWGLGAEAGDSVLGDKVYAWEDRCQIQEWLTLGICYHQAHHTKESLPYYRLQPEAGSPRQPGGYVVLLVAAMIPPIWRKLVAPALEAWRRSPDATDSPGHRLFCLVDLRSFAAAKKP